MRKLLTAVALALVVMPGLQFPAQGAGPTLDLKVRASTAPGRVEVEVFPFLPSSRQYEIRLSSVEDTRVVRTSTTVVAIGGIVPGVEYTFRVDAFDEGGQLTERSPISRVTLP